MTKAEHIQIQKAEKKVNQLMRSKKCKQIDLIYRYQGRTFIKTLDRWVAGKHIIKSTAMVSKVDTETEPFLFDCVSSGDDPLEPVVPGINLDIFRVILRSHLTLSLGLKESEIEAWLKELTIKS